MATLDFEVDSYRLSVYTQADTGLVWDNHHLKVRGLIICESQSGYRAVVYGLADNSYVPMNRYQDETRRVFIFTRERQFEWFRDLLRHEKPVFCRADPAHPGWFTLSTDAEPVGEEET